MDNVVVSIGIVSVGIGVIAAFLAFALLYRFTRMRGKQVALVVIAGVLVVYVPYAVFNWAGADVLALHLALFIITPYGLAIVTSQWEARRDGDRARQGGCWFHWAPATIVGFFLVIALVQAVVVTVAQHGLPQSLVGTLLPEPREAQGRITSHFPGTVAGEHKRDDAATRAQLRQIEAQQARGWQLRQGWLEPPVAGRPAILQLEVLDRDGRPLVGAESEGWFQRPSDSREDRAFEMRAVAPGRFQAEVTLPQAGTWNLVLRVRSGDDMHELRASTSINDG
ncbi:MAG: FixH family protein [Ectothiorhodospiraceae bacterium]|jgi:nitrogen fixation protein FixH|nr:FixH family protein [Ectothiorhodospiraceae bacterium]